MTLTLNFESHTINVAILIWLPFGELRCLLTTLVIKHITVYYTLYQYHTSSSYAKCVVVTDNTEAEVIEHRNDATYVSLPVTHAGLGILQRTNILVIIGSSGSGKTKCALDICRN